MSTPTQQAAAWAFFKELFQRLGSKSPVFFKVLSIVSIIAMGITYIPMLLDSTGIVLPSAIAALESKIVGAASIAVFVVSNLTVKDATTIAKDTTNDKLEFTAAKDFDVPTPPKK